jgi:hypothetical protein
LVSSDVDLRRPLQFKQMRLEDPVQGTRKRRIGIRARHLRLAASRGFDRSSPTGFRRWTAAITAYSLLLRGAEVGQSDRNGSFSELRGITWSEHSPSDLTGSFEWLSPEATHSAHHSVVVWVVPVKGGGRAARYPIMIRALRPGPLPDGPPADPLCVYSHLRWRWLCERHLHRPTDAFFAFPTSDGGAERTFRTRDMHALAVEIATLAGEDGAQVGAHSFRIGGATDIRDRFGLEDGKAKIFDRGRWCDRDLNFIYQRITVGEQLHVSAEMLHASSLDLEFLFQGWAQPARRRA